MADIKSLLRQDRNTEGGKVENVVIFATKQHTAKKDSSMLHVNKYLSSRRFETESPVVPFTGWAPKLTLADSQAQSHEIGVCK